MQRKQYGQLLFNAIRETLETMAFAEIVPFSMKIGDTELLDPDDLQTANQFPTQASQQDDGWGTSTGVTSESDAWGTAESPAISPQITDQMWANPLDAWGENVQPSVPSLTQTDKTSPIDFDKLMNEQDDWCWSCLKVNSAELDAIWLLVSKQLAQELARTMYAGSDFQLDSPALRDIIAELTNVLGGRLMLLLENMGGKFTLEVPVTGTGQPEIPNDRYESVTCKVFVDGTYPVVSFMYFKTEEQETPPLQTSTAKANE